MAGPAREVRYFVLVDVERLLQLGQRGRDPRRAARRTGVQHQDLVHVGFVRAVL
jgi:hypothetical protein